MSQEGKNISGIINAAKKVFGSSDDIWAATSRSFIPAKIAHKVAPYLVGILGFIIHAWELYGAMKDAWAAFKDKNMPQRKVRIGVGILSLLFTFTGLLICLSLVLYGAGFPFLIDMMGVTSGFFIFTSTCLLTGVYTLALFRKWYTYTQIKEEDFDHKAEAQREFAFGALEVISSAMVGIGILLTTDFFFSEAAISSFGILPIILLMSGVGLAFAAKLFEYKDEEAGNKYTAAIKEAVIETFRREENCYDITKDTNPLLQSPYYLPSLHGGEEPLVPEDIPYKSFGDLENLQDQTSESSSTASSCLTAFFSLAKKESKKEKQPQEKSVFDFINLGNPSLRT